MTRLLADLRYTLRQLRRGPGFAATAILTLALGVAANVIVFGVIDGLFLRSSAFPQASQISFIQQREDNAVTLSFPVYRDLRARNHTFSQMGAYRFIQVGLAANGHAQPRWAIEATGSYFDALGVTPLLGRFFHDSDDTHGANGSPYAVLSYATWKSDSPAIPTSSAAPSESRSSPSSSSALLVRNFTAPNASLAPPSGPISGTSSRSRALASSTIATTRTPGSWAVAAPASPSVRHRPISTASRRS
jgi:hypothetical protein